MSDTSVIGIDMDFKELQRKELELNSQINGDQLSYFLGNNPDYKGLPRPELSEEHRQYLRTALDSLREGLKTDDPEKTAKDLVLIELFTVYGSPYNEDAYDEANLSLYGERAEHFIKARRIRKAIGPVDVKISDIIREVREDFG